jgi:hypothetical protein
MVLSLLSVTVTAVTARRERQRSDMTLCGNPDENLTRCGGRENSREGGVEEEEMRGTLARGA